MRLAHTVQGALMILSSMMDWSLSNKAFAIGRDGPFVEESTVPSNEPLPLEPQGTFNKGEILNLSYVFLVALILSVSWLLASRKFPSEVTRLSISEPAISRSTTFGSSPSNNNDEKHIRKLVGLLAERKLRDIWDSDGEVS